MQFITRTPEQCGDAEVAAISRLAGLGFCQGDTPAMRQDTINHIEASDSVTCALDDGEMVAFAMVRGCLWRACA